MNIQSIQKTLPLKPQQIFLEHATGSSIFSPPSQPISPNSTQLTIGEALVKTLEDMGVRYAFGVSGGGIGPLWATLNRSNIELLHFRHESGAAFAACEAFFASDRPVVVFTTTGPGITNALTGLFAARGEGAKVILLSAATPTGNRGRWACQETSAYTMPMSGIFTSGPIFNYATTLESEDELPEISRRLALGLSQPGGFVAHISIPTSLQTMPLKLRLPEQVFSYSVPTASEEAIAECVKLLSQETFAIWAGFGAKNAAREICLLAEKTGAAVMTSPRGKGIFPEDHPQYVGVTGFSGHMSVLKYMQEQCPQRILVLGTRLGEPTSFWHPAMVPAGGFIHVDIDSQVPGVAYPLVETLSIQSEVKVFLQALLKQFPSSLDFPVFMFSRPERTVSPRRPEGLVQPDVLMDAIQKVIVGGSHVIVMAEAGNSFAWATHLLRFTEPGRYRISTGVGAMGHAVTGVLGAALGRNSKAVAIVGDGAMLMNSEVSTAVKFQIPCVWIVLNDGRYNMCAQGMALQGFKGVDTEIPCTDFVMLAKAMGADGICVKRESDIEIALETALLSSIPFVVDVRIDATQLAPIGGRIRSLIEQGAKE
ncbi:acetolactate synthase [Scytonema hofmannii PCC 7110]|uniref:Acetolactate synthase n=1 Tax=Scytonema hofmannii PCC 7110 TaxID=128403 RepID=A0A139WZS8_9CYAN|nr:ScyA-related TPP-binding enzyme [Scytonema hofmannii]KYC37951.1 acetolactate synthase [Scytonema hofmannii PCC 7110]